MQTNPYPLPNWTVPVETQNTNVLAQAIKEAASLIAEAIHANAEATVLLARATAGEFEEDGQVEVEGERYLDGTTR